MLTVVVERSIEGEKERGYIEQVPERKRGERRE